MDSKTKTNLARGKVKWFNSSKGYGFITVITDHMNGQDLFVHKNALKCQPNQYKYLVQGEYVEFEITKTHMNTNKYEHEAVRVTGIMEGELMCETRNNLAINNHESK
tara:strand:- start:219 stop:539 length:321 start_codon:yes stop_codon:yes gene_type:complete